MKLGLGTVQFGIPYGITNQVGVTSDIELSRISDSLLRLGISLIDTAYNYGNSEERLGALSWGSRSDLKIVTKCPSVKSGEELSARLADSLARLRCESVYGYLLHDSNNLKESGGKSILERLLYAREKGIAEKVGVSVYSADDALEFCERFSFDLVQLPMNVLDQRGISSGALSRLKNRGVEIHVRSAFLQGSLLGDPAKLPASMPDLRNAVEKFQKACAERAIEPIEACLAFLDNVPEVDNVVVGVTGLNELEELSRFSGRKIDTVWIKEFAENNPLVIDPRLWRR